MKKVFLSTILIIAMIFTLVSCSLPGPELNVLDAKKNLKSEGYSVTIENENIGVGIEEMLEARKGNDYINIIYFEDIAYASIYYKKLKNEYEYEIKELELSIQSIEYVLANYSSDLTDERMAAYTNKLNRLKKQLDNSTNYGCGMIGTIIWYGTARAIEDTKY